MQTTKYVGRPRNYVKKLPKYVRRSFDVFSSAGCWHVLNFTKYVGRPHNYAKLVDSTISLYQQHTLAGHTKTWNSLAVSCHALNSTNYGGRPHIYVKLIAVHSPAFISLNTLPVLTKTVEIFSSKLARVNFHKVWWQASPSIKKFWTVQWYAFVLKKYACSPHKNSELFSSKLVRVKFNKIWRQALLRQVGRQYNDTSLYQPNTLAGLTKTWIFPQ